MIRVITFQLSKIIAKAHTKIMHMYIYATTRDYHMILQLRDAVFPVVDEAQLNQATERES